MTATEARDLINEITDSSYQPNDWEEKFLKSVGEWVDKDRPPSPKQAEKLRQIYEKATKIEGEGYLGGNF